jgi:tetratricopeptide (TPR) repeat protein
MPAFPHRSTAVPIRGVLAPLALAVLLSLAASTLAAAPARSPTPVQTQTTESPLAAALAGEFAAQAGKLEDAARWYLIAAEGTPGDVRLAERAARLALLAKDDTRAETALALWAARGGDRLELRGVRLSLAIRRDDARTARRELDALMPTVDKSASAAATSPNPGLRDPSALDPGEVELERDPPWRHALSALEAGAGNPKLAAALLKRLLARDAIPNQLEAWLAFGDFAQRLDREDIADRMVSAVIARFPREPAAALLRISQLRDAGRNAEARAALVALEKTADGLPQLNLAVAREYSALGEHRKAADLLARGRQSDRTFAVRAAFLAQAEDKEGMTALYAEIQRDSSGPDPERRLLLAQIAEFLERNSEALDWYMGVPGGEERLQARLRIPAVLHELGRAAEGYARLRELQSDALADEQTRRDAYLLEADLHRRDKARDAEIDAFARGLAAYPDDGTLLYGRALMWERLDDIPRAEADFRKLLAIDQDDANALNALGYTLADRTNRYQEALELIARAVAAEPDNAAFVDSYGWVLYRLGRNREALAELRRAYTLRKDAEIAAHLAEVLWVMGEREEARKYFEESRKLDPDNRSLQRALEKTGYRLPPQADAATAGEAAGMAQGGMGMPASPQTQAEPVVPAAPAVNAAGSRP